MNERCLLEDLVQSNMLDIILKKFTSLMIYSVIGRLIATSILITRFVTLDISLHSSAFVLLTSKMSNSCPCYPLYSKAQGTRAHRSKHHIMQVGIHRQCQQECVLVFAVFQGDVLGPWMLGEIFCTLLLSLFNGESITSDLTQEVK